MAYPGVPETQKKINLNKSQVKTMLLSFSTQGCCRQGICNFRTHRHYYDDVLERFRKMVFSIGKEISPNWVIHHDRGHTVVLNAFYDEL